MPTPSSSVAAGVPASEALAAAVCIFLRSRWSLVLAVALSFLIGAATLPLTDVDEGAFAEATREMLAHGNWVSPTLDGQPRHDKPILAYWAQAVAVSALGESEFAYRLPSLLAAVLWLIAIHRFGRRHGDRRQAHAAALAMALSPLVGLVAKAATADALLNLFLCLACFGIYDYFRLAGAGRAPPQVRRIQLWVYGALGLGFLAKGPVAVALPLLAGTAFFVLAGAGRIWLRALACLPGWLLFLAIVVPWHVLVYLDQGDAFFRSFFLQHNWARYTSTFEGHGGNPLYYLIVLPFAVLPFTGRLPAVLMQALRAADRLDRFLLIWFGVVFVFFSLSRTQLPHYLLYGGTPLFILLARHGSGDSGRLAAFLPPLLFALALALLPAAFALLAARLPPSPASGLARALVAQFDLAYAGLAAAAFLAGLGLALWRRLPVWEGLVLVGLGQALVVSALLLPRVLAVTQAPVREAASFARQAGAPVVAWGIHVPSFSLYRQAPTPTRLPVAGELALTRADRVAELRAAVAPLAAIPVFSRGQVVLLRVQGEP